MPEGASGASRHWELLPQCALYNEYGPTEATVWSTVNRCKKQERGPTIPIGRSIPNVGVYVLNESLQCMAIGAVGELYIGGEGVAKGYLNQPALNAERFMVNPFSEETTLRLYRTGDLVRVDQQVKLREYRVEMGEIEAVLGQHPAVRETRVLVWYTAMCPGTWFPRNFLIQHSLRRRLNRTGSA
jgi:non-ribosomal peptide synthetase component F